ncbi:MAG: hypothetical protein ACI3Y5_09515 [Prevotella sp.]
MKANRLTAVIKWNLIDTKRALVRETAGLIIAPFCIVLANCLAFWIDKQPVDTGVMNAAYVTWFALFFLGAYWASRFCYNMLTKSNALNYMMLPATNGEKYVANMFMQTIVRVAETAFAIVCADILQSVVCLMLGIDVCSYSKAIIEVTGDLSDAPLVLKAWIAACIINLHSALVLGGCFFRKNHLVFTGISLFAISAIVTAMMSGAGYLVDQWAEANDCAIYIDFTISKTTVGWIGTALVTALSALFYWLSFKVFCRRQIISSRFFY